MCIVELAVAGGAAPAASGAAPATVWCRQPFARPWWCWHTQGSTRVLRLVYERTHSITRIDGCQLCGGSSTRRVCFASAASAGPPKEGQGGPLTSSPIEAKYDAWCAKRLGSSFATSVSGKGLRAWMAAWITGMLQL